MIKELQPKNYIQILEAIGFLLCEMNKLIESGQYEHAEKLSSLIYRHFLDPHTPDVDYNDPEKKSEYHKKIANFINETTGVEIITIIRKN
jgi:hypothetical protein